MLRFLDAIHDVARRSIPEDEMLWPLSMPPQLPTKDEEIKIAKLDQYDAVLYRRYLAKEYGKRKQMVSGIHFNFEYDQALIQQLYDEQSEVTDCKQFKTKVYMKVARNFLRYRWLITYLLGLHQLVKTATLGSTTTNRKNLFAVFGIVRMATEIMTM